MTPNPPPLGAYVVVDSPARKRTIERVGTRIPGQPRKPVAS